MLPPIHEAFGKLERPLPQGLPSAWHSLVDHMTDVAACFEALCDLSVIRRTMTALAGRLLTGRDLQRLAVLVFLHDLGKANSGFQSKRWPAPPDGWPPHAGHGLEGLLLFTRPDTFPRVAELLPLLPLDEISAWGDAAYPLLLASLSHHGRPLADSGRDVAPSIWQPVPGYDPAVELARITAALLQRYADAFSVGGEQLPNAPAFGHYFAGLVQLADWLGSDTRFFQYSEPGEDRTVTAPQRARRAVAAIGLDVHRWRQVTDASPPTFAGAFAVAMPRPMQTATGQLNLGQLVIVEAETGSGKTEAALWRFLQLFSAGAVDSLYFALPTRVSASQVYARILTMVQRLWPDHPPSVVRALPGYVAADDASATVLPRFQVLWADSPDEQRAHLRWAAEAPKRFLAAPVAVGTIDQVLMGILQTPHAHLRQSLLAKSLLVVDEVHASDPYMTVLLERLLAVHLAGGGHAVLLSATLGTQARDRYLAIARNPHRPNYETTPLAEAKAVAYPALWDARGLHVVAADTREKAVAWQLAEWIDDPVRIAAHALEAAAKGAKVLVIRNTVPAAVATLRALESAGAAQSLLLQVDGVATLHHSRFSRDDRPLLDIAIEGYLGKHRGMGPCIIVGTQTLEQSLDIDADYLITDLCPVDVLLQRIGRLHRHARDAGERPDRYSNPHVCVLAPSLSSMSGYLQRPRHGLGRFRDGGGVYADLRVLEATRRLVAASPVIRIPADNRPLVEAATHPQALAHVAMSCGPDWVAHGDLVAGDTGAQQTIGRLHTVDVTRPFDTVRFDPDLRVATRLGAQDRLLVFPAGTVGPFGTPLTVLAVRHHLLPAGLPPDTQPDALARNADGLSFTLGQTRYRYSRFGLERLPSLTRPVGGDAHGADAVLVG